MIGLAKIVLYVAGAYGIGVFGLAITFPDWRMKKVFAGGAALILATVAYIVITWGLQIL